MTSRRDFIRNSAGAMAGIAFVGCELLAARDARAQAGARRREVVVSGRRVKTVDIHAHCAFPRYGAAECPIYPEVLREEVLAEFREGIKAKWEAVRYEARPIAKDGKAM